MLKWDVFYHSTNGDQILTFNIFNHGGFRRDLKEAAIRHESKEEFAEAVRIALGYYFWSKCEWETMIVPWVGDPQKVRKKVDVCWQIKNAWDAFVLYCWTNREELKGYE